MAKAMDMNEINEVQIYMQLYDKQVISKKTLLKKLDIDSEEEAKQIKKENEKE